MKTSKSLRELLPDILSHIKTNLPYLQYNNRLLLVHEGQLRKEIEDSLRKELSPTAYAKAIQRVPSINLLVRLIDKLSRVYTDPAQRMTGNAVDTELLRYYEEQLDLTKVMPTANKMFNLHKSCALEPYLSEDGPALRVIPASRFMVYSDSVTDPLTHTVFIKLMGRELKVPFTNQDGAKTVANEPYYVNVYHLYSDDEILIIDDDGERNDKMQAQELDGSNPVGMIPFIYLNKSEFFLMPLPDTDTLDNTVLIPKLLADLNYAVQFQSHSITIATDIQLPADVPWGPDVVIQAKTDEGSTQQGHITTVKPVVDIEKVLLLIETTIAFWLEARNIKTTSVVGKVTAEAASSGIAKIIDEADATQDRRAQMTVFQCVEEELWELVQRLHEHWSAAALIDERRQFSSDFTVGVKYANVLPMQSEADETSIIRQQLELGLINKRIAMQRLNPHLGPADIDKLLKDTGDSDLALSGAQFKGLIELIAAVSAGTIPRDTAVGVISQAFSVLPSIADKMLASAGKDENGKQFIIGPGQPANGPTAPGQSGQSGPANSGPLAIPDPLGTGSQPSGSGGTGP